MTATTEIHKTHSDSPRQADWRGPALFRQGFRPFFLACGIYAVFAVVLWAATLMDVAAVPLDVTIAWHGHEMIFGMASAAVTGFVLTAIPNWTGRLPLRGWGLVTLFLFWLAGRLAMAMPTIGPNLVALVDASFLLILWAVVLREIVFGRNWRNLPIALLVGLFAAANIIDHLDRLAIVDVDGAGRRLGISVLTFLITLIGGRIIPSFTGNWLAKRGHESRPTPFGQFDQIVLLATGCALVSWVMAPDHMASAVLAGAAGFLNLIRLARWKGHHSVSEPLVWSLHLSYLWLPIGFVLMGLGYALESVPGTAGLHALTTGAVAGMLCAVMTRATRGHTGRSLAADGWTTAIYLFVAASALARVIAAIAVDLHTHLVAASAVAWCVGFGVFVFAYGRMLVMR